MTLTQYFQPHRHYFWEWETQDDVLSIPGGNTIAYRLQVAEILKALAPQGLPPLGALLLTVIATNPNGKTDLLDVSRIVGDSSTQKEMAFLNMLANLPKEYKTGKKRLLLFQAIFQKCHGVLALTSSRYFSRALDDGFKPASKEDYHEKVFIRDFRVIEIIAGKLKNVDDILARIAGLPILPEPIQLEQNETSAAPSDFIEELIQHTNTFHTGSLVKRIWSGLNIPVHSKLPSQQPLGGVSDLTNKGDFDKLLITEFANDDLVFMSRLANNEALYIHREIPPSDNDLKRIILVDVSLKNWGTPKTVAYATALAIAKHPKTDIECEVFAIGNTYHPVSFDNIHGVINGLNILSKGINAAQGLDHFFKDFPPNANREIFFITEPSTLKQPEMLRKMQEQGDAVHYLIHTGREGTIDVYKKQQNSRKHLQHLHLPLQELWSKKPAKNQQDVSLPSPYPALMRSGEKVKKYLSTSDGEIYQIAGDKTLMRLYDPGNPDGKGWEMICEALPFQASDAEIGKLSNGDLCLLVYGAAAKSLLLFNVTRNEQKVISFTWNMSRSKGFIFKEDHFYYHTNVRRLKINMNGDIEQEMQLPIQEADERRKELQELHEKVVAFHSPHKWANALRNVKQAYISTSNYLGLNRHELSVTYLGLQLKVKHEPDVKIMASWEHKKGWKFPDGSTVTMTYSGYVILKSSDPSLPEIYLLSLLDQPVAAAAGTDYCGHEYYRKNNYNLIQPQDFYTRYISVFIRNIMNHGN